MRLRAGLLLAFVLIGSASACGDAWEQDRLVFDYCLYGAQSHAQLRGCVEHVTAEEVEQRDSNAARWAREGGDCRADAGPFCQRALDAERDDYCSTPETHATQFCIEYRRSRD